MGSLWSLVKTHPCVLTHSPIENASASQSRKLAQNAMGTTSSMLCSERLRIPSTCCRKRCVGFIMKVWSGEPIYTKWYHKCAPAKNMLQSFETSSNTLPASQRHVLCQHPVKYNELCEPLLIGRFKRSCCSRQKTWKNLCWLQQFLLNPPINNGISSLRNLM